MLIADLKAMAAAMGIAGAGSMRKAQLVEAIKARQAGGGQQPARRDEPPAPAAREQQESVERQGGPAAGQPGEQSRKRPDQDGQASQDRQQKQRDGQPSQDRQQDKQAKQAKQAKQQDGKPQPEGKSQQDGQQGKPAADQAGGSDDQSEEDGGGRRNRRRRSRDRGAQQQPGQGNRPTRNEEPQILEDDVLVPAAGILDVLDNYAFVRTTGYLAGADDVYLSLSLVRKHDLRAGDAVSGQVRQPREGERKEKFNPMVRIDAVNGAAPDAARNRPQFDALTPVHPVERLRLETGKDDAVGRTIDLLAPIGKGQRALLLAPAGSGRTSILHSIAGSLASNNPECHLMVVLLDERPEEVTDFQRSVKGEVISSTFDRTPVEHTAVAELAIERAKRLVELGHDVVVLLDGITRLGRAYNLAASGHGRALPGGVDPTALHPPRKFFGAARNIEDGGSLTVVATAMVDSASEMDQVILDHLSGTANCEIRLLGGPESAFPAIDPAASGTRRPDLLLGPEELAITEKLRAELVGLGADGPGALAERLRRTSSNIDLLTRVRQGG